MGKLNQISRNKAEKGKGCVACAKIIKCNINTFFLKLIKNRQQLLCGFYVTAFGQLKNKATVRQIILGEGKPKKELRLQDNSKYLYLGADRATNKWTPFCFEEYQPQLLNGFLAANVIPRCERYYPQQIKRRDVYGYSYK